MMRRVYLYFALTFLLGIAIGACGVFFFAWNTGRWQQRGFNQERIIRHFKAELNLSDAQVQQLRQILDDTGKHFGDIQRQMEPQFQTVREDTRNRIRQILSPDQVTKFNEMDRKWDERHRQRPH